MFRVLRLGTLITKMNVPENIKALFNLFKLCFYLCMSLHILSCGWYVVCYINANERDPETGRLLTWYSPTDWLNYKESKLFDEDYSIYAKYSISLYHAVLMLGSNEMGPVNWQEKLFCVVAMLTTNIMNA